MQTIRESKKLKMKKISKLLLKGPVLSKKEIGKIKSIKKRYKYG